MIKALYSIKVLYIIPLLSFFFFNDTATTEIYTLSLHDALPICPRPLANAHRCFRRRTGSSPSGRRRYVSRRCAHRRHVHRMCPPHATGCYRQRQKASRLALPAWVLAHTSGGIGAV